MCCSTVMWFVWSLPAQRVSTVIIATIKIIFIIAVLVKIISMIIIR